MSDSSTYQLHETTPGALALMRSHVERYDVEVAGRSFYVLPGVWSPKYDWSSLFYVENFPDVAGKTFLEIGSGTGVISVFAGLRGAASVVAVDVNPDAVRNTRMNLDRHGLTAAVAMVSDGFNAVSGTFDIIGWNAPYHGASPSDMLERGCTDEGYRDIIGFFEQAPSRLNPAGLIVFGFSESGDLALIRTLFEKAGLRVQEELSDWRENYNCMLFLLARQT